MTSTSSPSSTAAAWARSSLIASRPVPETDWYVETTRRSSPAARWIGARATIACIVVQFGLATIPLWPSAASSLTPATTSGTSSFMRQ